ncbi:MAG: 4Fe-4S dicluster domain-containing protein, partial [Caldilineaceae bacterium]|nr:4Fe-4S dicluster domain-containing protein [Caldilineaceae bacterium]
MQHTIALETLGPNGESMAQAVDKCVHCGFCLSACPTYKVLGEEMDSPRGRIYLMKEVLEGTLGLDETLPYVDRCLGCMACVTACPSGVEYGHLLTPFRARAEEQRRRAGLDGVARSLVRNTLPYPARFRWAVRSGALARLVRPLLPEQIGAMVDLLPTKAPSSRPLPRQMAAQGPRRARVALLTGCVQQVLAPQINWATLRVLARNGVEVVVPPNQGCCGSLSLHIGEEAQAQHLARRNLAAFPADVDAIITNAAGCGSGMHEYPHLFAGQPDATAAGEFAAKVQDVTTFLDALGLVTP